MIKERAKIESLKFYANIAAIYDNLAATSPSFPRADYLNKLMVPHLNEEIDSILDVGIGTGLSSKPFVDQGYMVTGVDGCKKMLDTCAKKGLACELVQADFTKEVLPFSKGEFHAAFSANTLYLLPENTQEFVINELHRVTKAGGLYAFNYEPRKKGELGVRFNDATTDRNNPCIVETYSVEPERIRNILARHASAIVDVDNRIAARKMDGYPIIFETIICRNLG